MAGQLSRSRRTLFLGFGETLEEEGLKEFRIITILAALLRFRQLVAEIVLVASRKPGGGVE